MILEWGGAIKGPAQGPGVSGRESSGAGQLAERGRPCIGSSTSGCGGPEGSVGVRVKVAPESQAVTVLHPGQWPLDGSG